ncbi:MAG: cache domain-containing protein, partial [Nitrospirota bacterium]
MKLFKTNLKFRLLAFFFLLGIPVLIIGIIITYYNGSQNLKESIGKRFQEIAEQTADRTSFFIDYEFQKLQYLSSNPILIDEINIINKVKGGDIKRHLRDKGTSADLSSILNQFMRNNKDIYKGITITDRGGRVVASTKENGNHKDKEWLWMTAYNGIANISDFYTREGSYTSTGSIEFFVDVAIPIIDWREAEVVGVIKGTLSGEWITKTVVNSWIGKSGHTMLVTSDGLVAICPFELLEGDKDLHKLDNSTMNRLKALSSNNSKWDIVEDNTHEGKNAIAGFALIRLSPDIHKIEKQTWYIFVTQDPSETYAPLYSTLLKNLAFGLFLIIIFSIGSYYAAQRIV